MTRSPPGTGDDSQDGYAIFVPKQGGDRSGLLLLNGVVYLTWASHCEYPSIHRLFMGYDATTSASTYVLDVTPNGHEGAIWGAGAEGKADPSGNIYFLDADAASFDTTLNGPGLSD